MIIKKHTKVDLFYEIDKKGIMLCEPMSLEKFKAYYYNNPDFKDFLKRLYVDSQHPAFGFYFGII